MFLQGTPSPPSVFWSGSILHPFHSVQTWLHSTWSCWAMKYDDAWEESQQLQSPSKLVIQSRGTKVNYLITYYSERMHRHLIFTNCRVTQNKQHLASHPCVETCQGEAFLWFKAPGFTLERRSLAEKLKRPIVTHWFSKISWYDCVLAGAVRRSGTPGSTKAKGFEQRLLAWSPSVLGQGTV